MYVVLLILRLSTGRHQRFLLAGQAMLLDHGVVDMTTIYTSLARRPHLSIGALHV